MFDEALGKFFDDILVQEFDVLKLYFSFYLQHIFAIRVGINVQKWLG